MWADSRVGDIRLKITRNDFDDDKNLLLRRAKSLPYGKASVVTIKAKSIAVKSWKFPH